MASAARPSRTLEEYLPVFGVPAGPGGAWARPRCPDPGHRLVGMITSRDLLRDWVNAPPLSLWA